MDKCNNQMLTNSDNTGIQAYQESEFRRPEQEEAFFTKDRTKLLIECYKKYKPKVGCLEMRSVKKMFQFISKDISNICGATVSSEKCENKWKVLERSYKKVIDNNNKTGRARKVFEFEEDFNEIFGTKKNIRPAILLSHDIIPKATMGTQLNQNPSDNLAGCSQYNDENVAPASTSICETPKRKRSIRTSASSYKKRNEILLEMKEDMRTYYAHKMAVDKEKLELHRIRCEESKKRTRLLEEILRADYI